MKIYKVSGRFIFDPELVELSLRHPAVLDRPATQAQRCVVHRAAAAVGAARHAVRDRRLGAEDPVCRLRRGLRIGNRRLHARPQRRAVLQGELRLDDEAADDRLLSARGGAARVHPDRGLPVDLHPAVALRGDRDDPGDRAPFGRRALSVAAQARFGYRDAVGPAVRVRLHDGECDDRDLDRAGEPAGRGADVAEAGAARAARVRYPGADRGDGFLYLRQAYGPALRGGTGVVGWQDEGWRGASGQCGG